MAANVTTRLRCTPLRIRICNVIETCSYHRSKLAQRGQRRQSSCMGMDSREYIGTTTRPRMEGRKESLAGRNQSTEKSQVALGQPQRGSLVRVLNCMLDWSNHGSISACFLFLSDNKIAK